MLFSTSPSPPAGLHQTPGSKPTVRVGPSPSLPLFGWVGKGPPSASGWVSGPGLLQPRWGEVRGANPPPIPPLSWQTGATSFSPGKRSGLLVC